MNNDFENKPNGENGECTPPKETQPKGRSKKKGGELLLLCLIFGVAGIFGFFFGKYVWNGLIDGDDALRSVLNLLGFVLGMYLVGVFHVVVHETGHLIFGLCSGYKFSSFRVFSFMWIKENGRIRLKRYSLAGTGGQCLMVPPEMTDGKIPVVLFNLGGSFMNFATAVACLIFAFAFPCKPFEFAAMTGSAFLGLIFALVNGVPMNVGLIGNDGYNALAIRKDESAMRAFWVQLKVNEYVSRGVRLKDMPSHWFDLPSDEQMKNGMVATLGVFRCNYLMDRLEFDEADKLMEHLLSIESGIVGLYRYLMICDRMYIEIITKNRSDVINSMRSEAMLKFMKQMKSFPSVIRTGYAYALLVLKNRAKADELMKEFERVGQSYPYASDIESERELINIALGKSTKL